MKFRLLILLTTILIANTAFAQQLRLTGKVTNDKNEPLSYVTVSAAGANATTNTNGQYALNLDPGTYEISFTAVGFQTKSVAEVEVKAGQVNELNIVLLVKSKEEEGVVISTVRTTRARESVNSLITFQKNTNTVASVISAESIRRSPDRNTSEVLKRTPGASIQEGRFIIIRGLADRYNQAMLNGVLLTSTEPDRKTFSFDILPAPMIDNIIINKAFVPELPGEWAGGLIQVNTKDIPSANFFNIQLGTGFNTQAIGRPFFKDQGGKTDWLGFDDGTRALPKSYTTKSNFDTLSKSQQIGIGKAMRNAWTPQEISGPPINLSFQANGGFASKLFGKNLGGFLSLNYNKRSRFEDALNRRNILVDSIDKFSIENSFNDARYLSDVSSGILAGLSLQLNSMNRISVKSLVNVNSVGGVTMRNGVDKSRDDSLMMGTELYFRQNTFFTTQLIGEHTIARPLKFKWYGSFNILDGYVPDQRRLLYSRRTTSAPYEAVIGSTLSQQSGSRIYQSLSDYIYTGGGDLSYTLKLWDRNQTIKGGYMLQIKDRLYDAQLFANNLNRDNATLRQLPSDQIFAPQNFGDGSANSNLFGFGAIIGSNFRYMANTILNAGYIQFDNEFTNKLRVVWGLRVEDYDQLVGSVKKSDPRHTHSQIRDFLPGVNATYKLTTMSNLRLSGSQTVIRPELRELSFLNLYDFELNASVQGKPDLKRTKVSNADLRYELYPHAGEVFTFGAFYKYFNKPIEQIFNEGSGGASTFTYQNPDHAFSFGAEFEMRKKLESIGLKNFSFQANAAYIYSRIRDTSFKIDRPLQGQSPYLLNLGLMYDLPDHGISATLLFNQVGERIYLVGDKSAGAGTPDIYEAPRPLMDFQLAKKVLKNKAEVKLNASDLLNQRQYYYQNANNSKLSFQKEEDAYRFSRKLGTTFSLTFNYSL